MVRVTLGVCVVEGETRVLGRIGSMRLEAGEPLRVVGVEGRALLDDVVLAVERGVDEIGSVTALFDGAWVADRDRLPPMITSEDAGWLAGVVAGRLRSTETDCGWELERIMVRSRGVGSVRLVTREGA